MDDHETEVPPHFFIYGEIVPAAGRLCERSKIVIKITVKKLQNPVDKTDIPVYYENTISKVILQNEMIKTNT